MSTEKVQTPAQFEEIKSVGRSVFVLERKADYNDSMRILAENGLRPLTYQEALIFYVSGTPELKKRLQGKWFWLAGKGLKERGLFTFDENGNLKVITGTEKPSFEKIVHAWSGDQPLSFVVVTEPRESRFTLCAENTPDEVLQMLVGVKMEEATTKAAPEVLDKRQ